MNPLRAIKQQVQRRQRIAFSLACVLASVVAFAYWFIVVFERYEPVEKVFPAGELVIAIDPSYPPFGSIVDDQFVGLDVDLGRALAEALELTPRYVMVNYDSAYDAVKSDVAHVSLAALRVDFSRAADARYTWGYLNDGQMLVSQRGLSSGWDLDGLTVAVELGSAAHSEARLWTRRVRNLTLDTHAVPFDALDAMLSGEADAAITDTVSVREYLREHPGANVSAAFLTVEYYAGAVRSSATAVLYHVNRAMLQLLNDDTVDSLLEKWIGPEPLMLSP